MTYLYLIAGFWDCYETVLTMIIFSCLTMRAHELTQIPIKTWQVRNKAPTNGMFLTLPLSSIALIGRRHPFER